MNGWTPSDEQRRQEGEDIPRIPPGGTRRSVTPHDDLATIKEALGPRVPDKHASYLERVRNETLAALSRLETEHGRLEQERDHWKGTANEMAENEIPHLVTRVRELRAEVTRLREGLRHIAEIDERDDSRPIFFGFQNALHQARSIARSLLDDNQEASEPGDQQ